MNSFLSSDIICVIYRLLDKPDRLNFLTVCKKFTDVLVRRVCQPNIWRKYVCQIPNRFQNIYCIEMDGGYYFCGLLHALINGNIKY